MFDHAREFKIIKAELLTVNSIISETIDKCKVSSVERDILVELLHKNTETIQEIDKREYYGLI